MTSVTVLQCLTAALAVLLVIEVWIRRDEWTERGWSELSDEPGYEFRPELIVAWDDEVDGIQSRPCTRQIPADLRRSRRTELRRAQLHARTR